MDSVRLEDLNEPSLFGALLWEIAFSFVFRRF